MVAIRGSGHVGSHGVDPDWVARYHRTWLDVVGIGGSGHVGSQGVDPDWLARYHRIWLEARKRTCNDWIDAHAPECD